tara:strand:- start:29481 stop:31244 length:1764 start_codon:yes stop_codon:yes gene_type:complete
MASINKFEPYLDSKTQKICVGGLYIPPTNTLTALLYGFGKHKNLNAKEYYFWRICDELWNNDELPEKLMVRHPWATSMIKAALGNKYLAVGGAASSGKSHTMAAYAIVCWLAAPRDTLVLLTSTTLREARKRIWGSVITLLNVINGAPFRIRDSIGNVAYINEKGTLIEKAGLSLIACEKSKEKTAVGKFIGIKQKNVLVVADELSELSESILQAGLTNLSKNPSFKLIGMSNPASRYDAFGVWAQPEDGWDSVPIDADEWKTKYGGRYLRLDGERSPNIIAGKTIYPWLPTEEKLQEDRDLLGPDSRGYKRMVSAVFFENDEEETIYSESGISRSGSMNTVQWKGNPIPCAGLDPAFSNGGDRCILYTGLVGYDLSGQYVCELKDSIPLLDDATNTAVPRSYQIVKMLRTELEKRKIDPANLAVDSTGAGNPFCDIIEAEGLLNILRVSFGGKPSEKRVSVNSKLIGTELYSNRCSELWFAGKELMRTKQLFGISNELASEMTGRRFEMYKSGSLKMKIESKPEFKSRLGKSPDVADAAFLCIDVARQRLGLVAAEPPNAQGVTQSGSQKSIKNLTGMLSAQVLAD